MTKWLDFSKNPNNIKNCKLCPHNFGRATDELNPCGRPWCAVEKHSKQAQEDYLDGKRRSNR